MSKRLLQILMRTMALLMPWPLRRHYLQWCFGYKIHPTSRIRASWFFPRHLEMGAHSKVGPLCVAVHLDRIILGDHVSIGRGTWITGFPTRTNSAHFAAESDRVSELVVGEHAAITKNHHLDCTNRITVGRFSTIAGYRSQFLTHSIDLSVSRQSSKPIEIGAYCFVGTQVVVLGGSKLPDYSVLGAASLLNKCYSESHTLYGGLPATPLSKIPDGYAYFQREVGFVI